MPWRDLAPLRCPRASPRRRGEIAEPLPTTYATFEKDGYYIQANRFGTDAYEMAGVPLPTDLEDYSTRSGVQDSVPEGTVFDYDDYGDVDISAGDADFDAIRIQLDAMLTDCGYAPLNPRQPFDWMVLFGIATGDLFDLDERFETLLGELFGNAPQARPSRQL